MKRLVYILFGLMAMSFVLVSCDDEETYAEQKEREAKYINQWISNHDIDVITMADFLKDTITNNPETGPDTTRNEYVLFSDNGVYMQIVRRGDGRLMGTDETWYLNARYEEIYVQTGTTMTMNLYENEPDQFYVKRTGGNYTASFRSGIMVRKYGNSVPSSWIMMMPFIKPGILNGSSAAKVRIIAPHNQGTQTAAASVYPAFYEIIISKQKNQF